MKKTKKKETMKNTTVKWFNENYDLGCNIKELEKLGFTNSSWKDDIAPSYSTDKIQIYFLNPKEFKEHENRGKFSINKILNDESIKGIYETNNFKEVLRIVSFAKSLSNI